MKSEIRDSEIRALSEKVAKEQYSQYLRSIRLERIRGFQGAAIDFDFPVSALIGPNGSGKSTVLNSCALAYANTKAESLF
jgi:predicted ATPase